MGASLYTVTPQCVSSRSHSDASVMRYSSTSSVTKSPTAVHQTRMQSALFSRSTRPAFTAKELPNELWSLALSLVFGQLEDINDFAHLQLVSKSFHDLALQNCWTKFRKIHLHRNRPIIGKELYFELELNTAVQKQRVLVPIHDAAFVLKKVVLKTKIRSIHLNLDYMLDTHDQVLCQFLDALVAANVKVQEFGISNISRDYPQQTVPAIARFVSANTDSLTTLKINNVFIFEGSIPSQLIQAFRNCRALRIVEMFSSWSLVESVLHDKPQLKSLAFDSYTTLSSLTELGANLRHFHCTSFALDAYGAELKLGNCFVDHPLRSVKMLEIKNSHWIWTVPWALFPNLELLICKLFNIERVLDMVQSFMTQWVGPGIRKALECRVEDVRKGFKYCATVEDVKVTALNVANECGARVTRELGDGAWDILLFCKQRVTFKLMIQYENMEQ